MKSEKEMRIDRGACNQANQGDQGIQANQANQNNQGNQMNQGNQGNNDGLNEKMRKKIEKEIHSILYDFYKVIHHNKKLFFTSFEFIEKEKLNNLIECLDKTLYGYRYYFECYLEHLQKSIFFLNNFISIEDKKRVLQDLIEVKNTIEIEKQGGCYFSVKDVFEFSHFFHKHLDYLRKVLYKFHTFVNKPYGIWLSHSERALLSNSYYSLREACVSFMYFLEGIGFYVDSFIVF